MKIKAFNIDYDITEEDIEGSLEMEEEEIENKIKDLVESLPKTVEFETDEELDGSDIADKVTEITGYLNNGCEYAIILKGFNKDDFLRYLTSNYSGFEHWFCAELVENVVYYAIGHENVSKDQLVWFLTDLLPEVSFNEVAQFAEDDILTEWGKQQKADGLRKYGGREFWKYDK